MLCLGKVHGKRLTYLEEQSRSECQRSIPHAKNGYLDSLYIFLVQPSRRHHGRSAKPCTRARRESGERSHAQKLSRQDYRLSKSNDMKLDRTRYEEPCGNNSREVSNFTKDFKPKGIGALWRPTLEGLEIMKPNINTQK